MLGIHDYPLFVLTGILLNLTPGQDTMFILGRSLVGGRRSGIASAFGISAGSIVHTLAAALGLSAIIAASEHAFAVVKLIGATYLVYLGASLLLTRQPATGLPPDSQQPATDVRSAFRQGILTNVLNPKVALFFLAFLPQFIDPSSDAKTLAFVALGATFIVTGTIWCLVLAVSAARLRAVLLRRPNMRALTDRLTGALFVMLGIRLAWSR